MAKKLDSYLKTYRKRAGLTQDELVFLIGANCGAQISQYEKLSQDPGLKTAFAFQLLFGVPAQDIFPGVFEKVKDETLMRVQLLSQKLSEAHLVDKTRTLKITNYLSSGKEAVSDMS
ncbi:MAG: helix-turn-helix transcriptional regulator [Nitrospinales bacterium]